MSKTEPEISVRRGAPNPAGIATEFLWMLGTIASFILMMVAERELTTVMSKFEILAMRSLIGMAIMAPVLVKFGLRPLWSRRIGMHAARNAVHFSAQYFWIYGIAVLTLAEITALEFTTPIWAALIAALFLGERLSFHRIVAVVFGFAGVLIILRPGIAIIQPAALVVLFSALCYAGSVVMVKSMTRTEPPWVIVFHMFALQLPLGLIPALFNWVTPAWADLPFLLVVGVTALTAHYCMARAFQVADATVVSAIDFLRLPLTALVGFLVYAEIVDTWVLVGAVVIFASNYFAMWRETKAQRA